MLKSIKVLYKKLGAKVWGYANLTTNTIEIDSRLSGKKELEIILHESTHLINPLASEEEVERISILYTNVLWKIGFRKVDNNNKIPLQNGKK